MDTSGFYKLEEDNNLQYAPNGVISTYELHRSLMDTYDFPIDGWYWFNTEDEARNFFNLPKKVEPTIEDEPFKMRKLNQLKLT